MAITHLVLGDPTSDVHAEYMFTQLADKGLNVAFWDTKHWQGEALCSLHLAGPNNPQLQIRWYDPHTDQWVNGKDVKVVFWRSYFEFSQAQATERHEYLMNRDRSGLVEGTMRILTHRGCRFVNSLKAYQMHKTKPYQLYVAGELGLTTPYTWITNNPQTVRENIQPGSWIYKPVMGGAHTELVTDKDIADDRLAALSDSPVTFQQKIDGVPTRVFAFPEQCYGIEIGTSAIDYRDDQEAPLLQVPVPDNIQRQCWAVLEAFDLSYSGIDWMRQENGEWVFLEANPAAMFLGFEKRSGAPLTEALLKLLI